MTSAKDILAEGEGVFPADFCLRFHNGDDDMSFTPPLRRPAEGNCKYALGKAFGFGVTGGVNLLLDDEISESARSSIGAMPAPMVVDVDPGLPLLIIRARSVFGSSSPLPFPRAFGMLSLLARPGGLGVRGDLEPTGECVRRPRGEDRGEAFNQAPEVRDVGIRAKQSPSSHAKTHKAGSMA